jgi:hypothetical protein
MTNPSAASTANNGSARRDHELRDAVGVWGAGALLAAAAADEDADAVGPAGGAGLI